MKLYTAAFLWLFMSLEAVSSALPLTESARSLSEGTVELTVFERVLFPDKSFAGRFRLGAAVTEKIMISFAFDQVERLQGYSGAGDAFFSGSYFAGDYFDNTMHLSARCTLRVPIGPSVYTTPGVGPAFFGFNELAPGVSWRYDSGKISFHMSVDYYFRQAKDEKFYSSDFFHRYSFYNDAAGAAFGLNSSHLYPLVPFAETRYVFRTNVHRRDNPPVAGGSYNILDLCAGLRFFFTDEFHLSVYYLEALLKPRNYFSRSVSAEASVLF